MYCTTASRIQNRTSLRDRSEACPVPIRHRLSIDHADLWSTNKSIGDAAHYYEAAIQCFRIGLVSSSLCSKTGRVTFVGNIGFKMFLLSHNRKHLSGCRLSESALRAISRCEGRIRRSREPTHPLHMPPNHNSERVTAPEPGSMAETDSGRSNPAQIPKQGGKRIHGVSKSLTIEIIFVSAPQVFIQQRYTEYPSM